MAGPIDVSRSCTVDSGEHGKVHALFADYWEWILSSDPLFATSMGEHHYDAKLRGVSKTDARNRYERLREFQSRSRSFDPLRLSAGDQLNLKLLANRLALDLEGERFHNYQMPLTHTDGIVVDLLQLPATHSFHTVRDYENYLNRLRTFPIQVEQTIANMREGITNRLVLPRIILERIISQLEGIAGENDARKSPLYEPVARMPMEFKPEDSARLPGVIEAGIRDIVRPAVKGLLGFLRTEYLPNARTTIGLWDLPNGEARFQYEIKYHTNSNLTADEIFQAGLDLLQKQKGEQQKILKKVGFKGTIPEFNRQLQTDKRYRYSEINAVEEGYRRILREIEIKLPQAFRPRQNVKYEIKPLDAVRMTFGLLGYYQHASDDGKQLPVFFYNPYRIAEDGYAKYSMERLAYHEVVPGHHWQITRALALQDQPAFRRHQSYGAFSEGWAEYAVQLAKELGAFTDPYSEYSRLSDTSTYGLVVSTGIHRKKWTREQAVNFLAENSQLSSAQINAVIDDVIASIPGFVLGYKLGQLKIVELRARSEKELGNHFDLKEFHEVVLTEGSIPLDLLAERVEGWITKVKADKTPDGHP